MRRYLALVAGLAGVMTLSVSAQETTPRSSAPCPPGVVQAGQQLYASLECARCHMVGGRGNRTGKLDGVASKTSAEDLRKWLMAPVEMEAKLDHKPKVKMSSRKAMNLSDADVAALVAYLMTLR